MAWCEKLNIPLYIIKYDENIEKALEGLVKDTADAPDMEERDEILEEAQEATEDETSV